MKGINEIEMKACMEQVGRFIADYVSLLWGCGATCLRIEKNVKRIAHTYGFDADFSILPKHISIVMKDPTTGKGMPFSMAIAKCGINYDINARLSSLSWTIADNYLCISEAQKHLDTIKRRRYKDTNRILFLASLANASFCRLFGGDALAMGAVFVATLIGMFVKTRLLKGGVDLRLTFLICAFISSAICCGTKIFGVGFTSDIAIATSVLYLIPGVPYINSASDLLDGHYLCAITRFLDALVLTCALTIGLFLSVTIMNIGEI